MTNKPEDFELKSEVVIINNVPQLKVSYVKEKTNKEGVVIVHGEGYEIHNIDSARTILEGENARTQKLKDTKTQKVLLTNADHKWIESQKRVLQHNDCQQKMKQSGLAFDEHLKDEQKLFEKQQKVNSFWHEAVVKLDARIKNQVVEELKKKEVLK